MKTNIFLIFFLFLEAWLKRRWLNIRSEHIDSETKGCDPSLIIDFLNTTKLKALNQNKALKVTPGIVYITQTMLDNCDFDNSPSFQKISVPIKNENENNGEYLQHKVSVTPENRRKKVAKEQPIEKTPISNEHINVEQNQILGETRTEPSPSKKSIENAENSNSATKASNERCEEDIFGELVAAMLKKMSPAEKKRIKKEIMNLLL